MKAYMLGPFSSLSFHHIQNIQKQKQQAHLLLGNLYDQH